MKKIIYRDQIIFPEKETFQIFSAEVEQAYIFV